MVNVEDIVSVGDRQELGPVEEANSRLADGLKSCRAVLRNYRSLLTVELNGDAATRLAVPLERNDSDDTPPNSAGGG